MTAHATFNGQTIAESDHTIVVEGNHYFPGDDVRDELLHATSSRTLCPWKGIANYWTVEVDGIRAENAAWGYRRPLAVGAARERTHRVLQRRGRPRRLT
jgi:uncharacterized protein (DUF427 family)